MSKEVRTLGDAKLRSPGKLALIVICAAVLTFVCAVLELGQMARQHLLDDVITVKFDGLSLKEMEKTRCSWLQPDRRVLPTGIAHYVPGTSSWMMSALYMGHLGVQMPGAIASKVHGVTVTAGGDRWNFAGPDPFRGWARTQTFEEKNEIWQTFELFLPGHSYAASTELGWRMKIAQLCAGRYIVVVPLVLILIGLFLYFSRRERVNKLAAALLAGPIRRHKPHRIWLLSGLLIVAAALTFLESTDNFYFTQDDNFLRFLPVIEQGARSLFDGQINTWNPYQLLGAPTLTLGAYALTYPVTYIAYGLGALILPGAHVLVELFAALHILAGYLIMYAVVRRMGVRPSLAALAAVSFVLSGFILIAGRSWYHLLPLAVSAPLMVLLTNRLLHKPPAWGWTLAVGAAIGLFYHAGNIHVWLYALFLSALTLTVAVLTGRIAIKRLFSAVPALLIGLGIAAPLVVLQWQEGALYSMPVPYPYAGIAWLNLFLPLGESVTGIAQPLLPANFPYPRELCYSGAPFAAAALLALFFLVLRVVLYKKNGSVRMILQNNLWLPAMLVSLTFVCGSEGILWDVTSLCPIGTAGGQPLEFIGFFAVSACAVGAVMLERWLTVAGAHGKRLERLLIGGTLALLAAHLMLSNVSLYGLADKPYPALPAIVDKLLGTQPPQRIFSSSGRLSRNPGFYLTLPHNLATAYKVLDIGGDDLTVEYSAANVNATQFLSVKTVPSLQLFGARYLLFAQPAYSVDQRFWTMEGPDLANLAVAGKAFHSMKKITDLPDGAVYQLSSPAGMAYVMQDTAKKLPLTLIPNGVNVDVSSVAPGLSVGVNFLARPWLVTELDGKPARAGRDDMGRVYLIVPNASKVLTLRYDPPWSQALALGAALIAAGCAAALLVRKRKPAAS